MKVVCSLLLVYKYQPVISICNMYFACAWTCMTVTFVSQNAVSKPTACKTVLWHLFTWHTTRIRVQTAPLCSRMVLDSVQTVPESRRRPDGSRRCLDGSRWCPDGSRLLLVGLHCEDRSPFTGELSEENVMIVTGKYYSHLISMTILVDISNLCQDAVTYAMTVWTPRLTDPDVTAPATKCVTLVVGLTNALHALVHLAPGQLCPNYVTVGETARSTAMLETGQYAVETHTSIMLQHNALTRLKNFYDSKMADIIIRH